MDVGFLKMSQFELKHGSAFSCFLLYIQHLHLQNICIQGSKSTGQIEKAQCMHFVVVVLVVIFFIAKIGNRQTTLMSNSRKSGH